MTERKLTLDDWLDDLCVRFIMNVPIADAESIERMCFQIEEAQWFYEDFIRPLDPELPSLTLRTFCDMMFQHCPTLARTGSDGQEAFDNFMMYKARIPVRGAILLNENMDSVVLVKGWKKGANWSFPRGKINMDEDDLVCAIREVYEETGYDLQEAGLVPEDRNVKFIDVNLKEQQMRLFVFRDVPMDTYFEPRTRKEISRIEWWQLSDLPAFKKKNKQDQSQGAIKPNQFYMVAPFLAPLRRWVIEQKKLDTQRPRVPIHQQLATVNQDDFLTDEDPGAESQGPSFTDADVSEFDHDQVLDATATINRLFKIQPRPEDFIAAAPTPPPPPPPQQSTKNTGQALLALLHSNPGSSRLHQSPPRGAPLHTPLDQTFESAPVPRNPHHQHPRPPPFSNMPPPPSFPPMHPPNDSFTYQQQEVNYAQQRNNMRQRQIPQHESPRNQGPHPYQPQHLIHPQPLPPHVQKAVFTGSPVHAPMVPPPVQQQPLSQFSGPVSGTVPNSQFQGLNAPMVPAVQKQSPPQLTSHSLALLNAFKSRDQVNMPPVSAPSNPPPREYEQPIVQPRRPQPHELPGDASQPPPVSPYNHPRPAPNPRGAQIMDPNIFAARPPISENQRSTLLGLFKSPTTPNSLPAQPASANALPTSRTPSAVELSAVEPLSENAASTSALLNDRRAPSQEVKDAPIPEMNPELNLPFRARAILTRPSEMSDEPVRQNGPATRTTPKANGKKPTPTLPSQLRNAPSPKKPFQPQILKRPQAGSPRATGSPQAEASGSQATPTQASYATFSKPEPRKAQPSTHMQTLLERHAPQPPEHKQALLSLFGKPAMAESQPITKNPSTDRLAPLQGSPSNKSRVSNLASAEAAPRRGSGSPLSPADTSFLLGYLENAVKGV